jgi:hypothetical protein
LIHFIYSAASCTNIVRLNDTAGVYIKSLCAVDTSVNYAAAVTTCSQIGMKLLVLDTQKIFDSFVAGKFVSPIEMISKFQFKKLSAMPAYHSKYLTLYIR